MSQVFTLPDVGEGLTEADILAWKVSVGDTVTVNQVLVEIETAKSVVELPSPFEGTVQEIMVAEGDTVDVGTPIITVGSGSDAPPDATVPGYAGSVPENGLTGEPEAGESGAAGSGEGADSSQGKALVGSGPKADPVRRRRRSRVGMRTDADTPQGLEGPDGEADEPSHDTPPRRQGLAGRLSRTGLGGAAADLAERAGKIRERGGTLLRSLEDTVTEQPAVDAVPRRPGLAKPPVRKAARELGIDLADVRATGDGGQVTKRDLLAHAERLGGGSGGTATASSSAGRPADERVERLRVKGVRKATAQNMVRSAFTAPHVSIFVEVDATRTMEFVQRLKKSPSMEGVKISPLLIVAKAVIWAAQRNPQVNATWTDSEIIVKHFMNLGIAAATPRGLLVPNIKDAQDLGLRELAEALQELTQTARAGRTQPADMQGGTLSITNIGVLGADFGTPIINPGESAIVAFGNVKQKPWVVAGEVVPRWITTLAGSFDHRVVDGELAAHFMADVARILEEPALLLE
ncbi:dihydrolipoamide acetyltransferase family protein [Kocuria tytonis]|uniref:Dihydrolipoamide acetyltransferase component of pyruvate dehydrogenase complex n=1 Tax=Kocuria tytonis TaxID=2054280 RepID=A0A495A8R9_9MICC|nr:dihydrolipoamide acetyltransferase family protein [Kocuria tytonis]RKQ34877.1 2-oxo acid dehydrogenase subunit E2 [Kocuria tytonis]